MEGDQERRADLARRLCANYAAHVGEKRDWCLPRGCTCLVVVGEACRYYEVAVAGGAVVEAASRPQGVRKPRRLGFSRR